MVQHQNAFLIFSKHIIPEQELLSLVSQKKYCTISNFNLSIRTQKIISGSAIRCFAEKLIPGAK